MAEPERDLAWFLDRIPDDLPADPVPLTADEMSRQSIEAFIAARTDRIPMETTVPEPTEPQQDVPDDLVQIGVDAWQASGRVFMDRATRAILAAVLPVHERRVREEAAREIHVRAPAYAEPLTGPRASFRRGMLAAAQHIAPTPTPGEIADAINRGDAVVCDLSEEDE